MTSERQSQANRNNAKRSTGPTTVMGKMASSRNALRHGLAASSGGAEAILTDLVDAFGRFMNFEEERAVGIVQSRLALARIRSLRHQALATFLQPSQVADLACLRGTERYERAALARQKKLLRSRGGRVPGGGVAR
jgi:hypothetical protein